MREGGAGGPKGRCPQTQPSVLWTGVPEGVRETFSGGLFQKSFWTISGHPKPIPHPPCAIYGPNAALFGAILDHHKSTDGSHKGMGDGIPMPETPSGTPFGRAHRRRSPAPPPAPLSKEGKAGFEDICPSTLPHPPPAPPPKSVLRKHSFCKSKLRENTVFVSPSFANT